MVSVVVQTAHFHSVRPAGNLLMAYFDQGQSTYLTRNYLLIYDHLPSSFNMTNLDQFSKKFDRVDLKKLGLWRCLITDRDNGLGLCIEPLVLTWLNL